MKVCQCGHIEINHIVDDLETGNSGYFREVSEKDPCNVLGCECISFITSKNLTRMDGESIDDWCKRREAYCEDFYETQELDFSTIYVANLPYYWKLKNERLYIFDHSKFNHVTIHTELAEEEVTCTVLSKHILEHFGATDDC